MACLDKLDRTKLSVVDRTITTKDDGTFWDGEQPISVTAVFDQAGKRINPAAISEQGPFLLVIDGKKFAQAATLDRRVPAKQVDKHLADGCPVLDAKDNDVTVDLARRSVLKNPKRNVIGPNEGLTVYVCHDPRLPVSVTWGGARGLTAAQITGEGHAGAAGDGARQAELSSTPIRFTFAPRQAGAADLKLFETDDITGKPAMTLELEVEPRYWGAVRFGLGTLFGNWKAYDIGTFAGSRQPQVRETSQGATFELVSGFAPYLLDLFDGGRSQTGGPNMRFAPFVGFGVLGVKPDKGIQGLSSIHLGVELEAAANLSIAVTFAFHRGRQLAMGYRPGAPVESDMTVDNVTTDVWERGIGLVINASPSFLQFATGESTGTGANR